MKEQIEKAETSVQPPADNSVTLIRVLDSDDEDDVDDADDDVTLDVLRARALESARKEELI